MNTKLIALAGVAMAALATPVVAAPPVAAAAKPAPVKPAPLSVLAKSVDIPYQAFTLPNGLRVIVHTDRKAPIVAVSVWYNGLRSGLERMAFSMASRSSLPIPSRKSTPEKAK